MKHTFKIQMEIEISIPDAPEGTPDHLQDGLVNGFADAIGGMISHQSDIIAESKSAEVVDFSYELPCSGGSLIP